MIKKRLFYIAISFWFLLGSYGGKAQGLSVNTTGDAADASAILDVYSTTQGMLVPRMPAAARSAIASPATGLLVYQTDGAAGFYFYTGAAWVSLNAYTNVTTQGNTFNGSNELVQANASGVVAAAQLGSGTASTSTFLRGDNSWAIPTGIVPGGAASGDLTGTYPGPSLAASGVTAGTYGSSTAIPVLTIDAKGRTTTAAIATVPLLITTSFNNTGNAATYFPLGGTVAVNNNTTITEAETQVPVGFTITAMTVVIYNTTANTTKDKPTITLYNNETATTMSYQYTTGGGFKDVGQYKSGIVTPTAVTVAAGDMLSIDYSDSQGGYTENVTVTFYGHY